MDLELVGVSPLVGATLLILGIALLVAAITVRRRSRGLVMPVLLLVSALVALWLALGEFAPPMW